MDFILLKWLRRWSRQDTPIEIDALPFVDFREAPTSGEPSHYRLQLQVSRELRLLVTDQEDTDVDLRIVDGQGNTTSLREGGAA